MAEMAQGSGEGVDLSEAHLGERAIVSSQIMMGVADEQQPCGEVGLLFAIRLVGVLAQLQALAPFAMLGFGG
jgi:hypothetical protein